MRLLSVEEAARQHWDCILIGTSFAAMFFALGLNRKHGPRSSTLFVERGLFASHADQIANPGLRPYEEFSQDNASGHYKNWVACKLFGGNSNCWSGCVPRQTPNDFRARSRYGVGADWPVSYRELEPFYCDVEDVMEIAGGGVDHIMPRSRPYPYPAHAPSMPRSPFANMIRRPGSPSRLRARMAAAAPIAAPTRSAAFARLTPSSRS